MLTAKQKEAVEFISGFIAETGSSPSMRVLSDSLGYHSTGMAWDMVRKLKERGAVSVSRKGSRGRPQQLEVIQRVAYFKFDEDAKELKMITPG
jgi:SOS-response transcriptional repressor LexA